MFQPGDVEYMPPSQPQSQQRRAGFGSDTSVAATGYFSSPSDLLNAGQQTNDAFMQMFNAVDANRSSANPTVPKSVRDQFVPFAIGWNQFFQQNFSNIALVTARWLTSDLQTHLVSYQQQIAAWGEKLKKYIGADAGSAASLKPGSQGGAKNVMMWIGIGAVTLVGLFMIGKLVHTVAFGDARLEEAEDEAMRLLEEKKRKRHDRTAFSIT
jgi:hypothetical protein